MASKSNFSFALERARLLFAAHLSAFHRRRKRINFEIDSESEKEREYNQINSGTNKLARPCFLALLLEADDDGSLRLLLFYLDKISFTSLFNWMLFGPAKKNESSPADRCHHSNIFRSKSNNIAHNFQFVICFITWCIVSLCLGYYDYFFKGCD